MFLNSAHPVPVLCNLKNAESPVSPGHGMKQEMTITTKAKYDSKCHGVPHSCDRVTTRGRVDLVSLHAMKTF